MRLDSISQSKCFRLAASIASKPVLALLTFALFALVFPPASFGGSFTEATWSGCLDLDCANIEQVLARVPGQNQYEAACRQAWATLNPLDGESYVQGTSGGQCVSQRANPWWETHHAQLHTAGSWAEWGFPTPPGPALRTQVYYDTTVQPSSMDTACQDSRGILEAQAGMSLGTYQGHAIEAQGTNPSAEFVFTCLWQFSPYFPGQSGSIPYGDFYIYGPSVGTGSWRNVDDADPKDAGVPQDVRQRQASQGQPEPADAGCHPDPGCMVGDPINAGTGNQFQIETDYAAPAPSMLRFERAYNSGTPFQTGHIGSNWRTSYDRSVKVFLSNGQPSTQSPAVAYRPDGRAIYFTYANGQFTPAADISDRLTAILDANNSVTGFTYAVADGDEIETYDATGRLVSIASRATVVLTLTYDTTNTRLLSVHDQFGRTLQFAYDAKGRIATMTDPASGVYVYGYDANGRLTSVEYPDLKTRTYVYDEPANTGGADLPNALTGIIDENNQRFATFKYDTTGKAVYAEHAGGATAVTLTYGTGTTNVVDGAGATRTYDFSTVLGATRLGSVTQPSASGTGSVTRSITFDANGNIASRTDWDGNRTDYTYDLTRNLETSRTEGLTSSGTTTPVTRTITTQWDANFRLPTVIAAPLRITTNVYDADGTVCGARGGLCSTTIQPTSDANGSQGFSATPSGTPRTWTFTYNANGSMLTVDGPRTDVSDITTYAYYANDDADVNKRGNVATITNAASQVTSVTAYNEHGQPLTIIDPNGMTITLGYDARERLKTGDAGGEITSYDYDDAGQLIRLTLPDGSYLSYGYDGAHRLTSITDNLGDSATYTLDAMGNRTHEEVRDPANSLVQVRSRVYNNLNRLFQELGAQNQTTQYSYDDQGNVLSVADPLNHVTGMQYDALNRVKQVTDPGLGVTQYAYNGLDALTQVTDPRSLVTGYSVDGLGNLTLQSSPDTGSTANTYDAAGNLLTRTDAKNQVTTYAYDALNRVSLITFHDGSKQAYTYDQGANAIGRLTSIIETDPSNTVTSQIAYAYDLHGRVTSETTTVAGVQYVIGYSYDTAGRLVGMSYPDGRTLTYTLDGLGRVTQIDTTKNSQTQTLVSSVTYQPFGAVKSFTSGNGLVYARSYDQDGRIASYTLGPTTYGIGYDDAGRIEFISDTGNPSNSNTYGYDPLDRLTSAVTPTTPYSYGYDAVGNRQSKTVGASTDTYTYDSASNRIASITPASGPVRNFVFDANGSTTADGNNAYAYDARGRMVQATSDIGTTTYQVNALGQRVRKTSVLGDSVFHYDIRGHLIAETDPGGGVKREIFYLGDIPVAVFQ